MNVKEDMEGKWTGEGGKRGSDGNVPREGWTCCWEAGGKAAQSLSSQSLPSPSSLLPHPAQHCHGTEFSHLLDKDTHIKKKQSSQLQGSKFQIWLHLEETFVPAFNGDIHPTLKIPSDTLRNTVFLSS